MLEVLPFVLAHWDIIAGVLGGLGILAVAVIRKTKTKKDDAILKSIRDFKEGR